MKSYIVYHHSDGEIDEKEETKFEYSIGEVIRVNSNSNQYKCVKKEVINGELLQHFKQGIVIYTFDY